MKQFWLKLFFGKPEYNKVVRGSSYAAQRRNLLKIWNNEKHHDIGFEKILRLFLVASQFIFPGLHVRNFFGKFGFAKRNVANEFYVLLKTCVPLFFLYSGLYRYKITVIISSYLLVETICYVSSLIFVADMFVKPRSYRRNILMLFLNYLEISFSFALIYASLHLLGDQPKSLYDYIYFSIITSTTIGYGDFHPVGDMGKIMVSIQAVMVVAFIVLFLNFFGSKVETLHHEEDAQ
jgi:Ion channel